MISLGGLRVHEPVYIPKEEMAGSLTPLVLFIVYLRYLFLTYSAEWFEIFRQIEGEIGFTVSYILIFTSLFETQ